MTARVQFVPVECNAVPAIALNHGSRVIILPMIFAELRYGSEYADVHAELLSHVRGDFAHVESGLQSDSWIWIMDGGEQVAIDTFTAMTHQVKSRRPGPHVAAVIASLSRHFDVVVYPEPVREGHDDIGDRDA